MLRAQSPGLDPAVFSKSLVTIAAFGLSLIDGACATAQPSPLASGSIPQVELNLLDQSTLRVVYRLAAPTTALAFSRSPDDSRTREWRPTDPAFLLMVDPDTNSELVRRRDNAAFSSVEFLMEARYSAPPKDYAPFMPFHEDGLLIHTGRLQACALRCNASALEAGFPMTITPPTGSRVLVGGELRSDPTTFVDMGSGRMVYVGAAAPIETAHAVTMIDPALPGAFRERLDDLLPRALALFESEFGALRSVPELYAKLDPSVRPDGDPSSNTFSSHGGVLPGQVFMHLLGDGWTEDPALWGAFGEGVAWFFAHEAAHLFQHLEHAQPSPDDAWIHEGGADALAALATLQLGMVSESYVQTRVRESTAICVEGLQAGPLSDASSRGAFEMHYACGMLLQLAAHQETRGAGENLYSIWRRFLSRVQDEAPWDANVFVASLHDSGAPSAARLAQRVLSTDETLTAANLIQAAWPAPRSMKGP